MKNALLFIFLYSLPCISVCSGQSLLFCENVTPEGKPQKISNTFTVGKNGGFLDLFVELPTPVQSSIVRYDIYRINEKGKEDFDATYQQEVNPESQWFWKEITFLKAGEYNVYVYDDSDKLLIVGKVRIITD